MGVSVDVVMCAMEWTARWSLFLNVTATLARWCGFVGVSRFHKAPGRAEGTVIGFISGGGDGSGARGSTGSAGARELV